MQRLLSLSLAVVLGCTIVASCRAQGRVPPPPPEPEPVVPVVPPPVPPPPPPGAVLEVPPPPLPPTAPVLVVPAEAMPYRSAWFSDVEIALAFPHLHDFPDMTTVTPDATIAGGVRVGYRFNFGGAVRLNFAGLEASGSADAVDDVFGPGRVRSSIDNFFVDVDYVSTRLGEPTAWMAQWNLGVRFVNQTLESQFQPDTGGTIVGRNEFDGAGAHAGLELSQAIGSGGLALYGRVDGGVVFGDGRQEISAHGGPFSFGIEGKGPEQLAMINLQLGVRWLPTRCEWFQLVAGYQYERWWMQTRGEDADDAFFTRLGFDAHGPFLRFELGY